MKKLKIAVIGSGSTYTPELVEGFIKRKDVLPLGELYLMDIDERKRTIVGGLCQRMIEAAGIPCRVILTDDLDASLEGADFVLTQIRVGKLPARVLDEKIPLKYGLIGQETCGIGGVFKALRTVPVILGFAERMSVLCPDAFMINFTNPAGIVTQAVLGHTKTKAIGLCNVPYNMELSVKKWLQTDDVDLDYVGLNHLSWITAIRSGGKDYLQAALEEGFNTETMKNIPSQGFSPELIKAVGAIPSSYMEYYYFPSKKLQLLQEAEMSRGEKCIEIEEELLKIYADSKVHTKPALLASRGGANYSEVAVSLVDAIYNDKNEIHVVNTLNNGALPFMDDGDVVETSAVIGRNGAQPVHLDHFSNRHIIDYMKMVKSYELFAVEAAITGSEAAVTKALLINPLVGDYQLAHDCFNELREAHKQYLPQFA